MQINFDNFKELGRDIRSFPKLVAWIVLLTMLAALAGYMIFIGGDREAAVSDNSGNQSGELEELCTAEEGTGEFVASSATGETEGKDDVAFVRGGLKVMKNESLTAFEVWNDGIKAGEIRRDAPAQVDLWRESDGDYYLGASRDGLGGYILFGGPDEVYRLDTAANTLERIYSGAEKNGFAADVLRGKLAAVEFPFVADGQASVVAIYDFSGREIGSYPVPARYGQAGAARFSQVGGRIIYEAAVGNPDDEEYAMFMIDLATGKQEQVGGKERFE